MRLTVIYPDSRVVKDGVSFVFELPPIGAQLVQDAGIHAIQWHEDHGEIETATGNVEFTDPAVIQPYVDMWQAAYDAANPPPTFETRQADKISGVRAEYAARVGAGQLVGGLHVQIDDGSRANLGGMALTGALVQLAVQGVTWPDDYARGWVSVEGERIPLSTPADGIALAFSAGQFYSALVQHEQDLIDAITAAANQAALDAIDITSGWPS